MGGEITSRPTLLLHNCARAVEAFLLFGGDAAEGVFVAVVDGKGVKEQVDDREGCDEDFQVGGGIGQHIEQDIEQRCIVFAGDDRREHQEVAQDAAEERQPGPGEAEDLIDALAEGANRPADHEGHADSHPANLVVGQVCDGAPQDGAEQGGDCPGGDSQGQVLFLADLFHEMLDFERVWLADGLELRFLGRVSWISAHGVSP